MSSEAPASHQENHANDSDSLEVNKSSNEEDLEKLNNISEISLDQELTSDNQIPSSSEEIQSEFTKNQSNQIADNEARLEQLEKEHETLKSQYMRIAADFDNFRKRQTRDHDDFRIQLLCTTLSEILPVVDNFERARQQLNPEGEEAQNLHRSYQGLYKQLVDILKQLGVAPMRVLGQKFDPNLHEAVMRQPSEEQAEDIIIEELQRGYHLNGRVLRHALVKVSMGPGPQQDKVSEVNDQISSSSNASNADAANEED